MKAIYFELLWLLITIFASASAKWKWPETTENVPISNKHLKFIHRPRHQNENARPTEPQTEEDEATTEHFQEARNTDGFYNRARPFGRYAVKISSNEEEYSPKRYRVDSKSKYYVPQKKLTYEDVDEHLGSLEYCRCTNAKNPECERIVDKLNACGKDKYLCCFKKTRKELIDILFSGQEDDEDNATLMPGRDIPSGPFPPPPDNNLHGLFSPRHIQEMTIIGQTDQRIKQRQINEQQHTRQPKQVLVGPGDPISQFGPNINPEAHQQLISSQNANEPTKYINSNPNSFNNPYLEAHNNMRAENQRGPQLSLPYLDRPDNPTGSIGPIYTPQAQPESPSNVLGPSVEHQNINIPHINPSNNVQNQKKILFTQSFDDANFNNNNNFGPPRPISSNEPIESASAQRVLSLTGSAGRMRARGVLVGPGGFMGNIGQTNAARYPRILTGPQGPSGNIGPPYRDYISHRHVSAGQFNSNRGVLVGPGGPTGRIGPDRGVLVGPGGPTGRIGPDRGVLVGPGGPTGRVGPDRGVLVGPRGYTGRIGPKRGVNKGLSNTGNIGFNTGVLTGPGGPTGRIGPERRILSGPGGLAGSIGPETGILSGPGGPTGFIGINRLNRDLATGQSQAILIGDSGDHAKKPQDPKKRRPKKRSNINNCKDSRMKSYNKFQKRKYTSEIIKNKPCNCNKHKSLKGDK